MDIKYLKGALSILAAMATPFGAFAMNETSLRAAIIMAVIAGISSAHNWLDQAFQTPDEPVQPAPAPAPAGPPNLAPLPPAAPPTPAPSTETAPPSSPLATGKGDVP